MVKIKRGSLGIFPNPGRRSMGLGCVLVVLCIAGPALAVLQTVTSTNVTVIVPQAGRPQYMLNSITVGANTIPLADLVTGTTTALADTGYSSASADTFDLNDYFPRTAKGDKVQTVYFGGGTTLFRDRNGSLPDFFIYEVGNATNTNWCDASSVRLKPILADGTIPADTYRINNINNFGGGFVMDPANPALQLLIVDDRPVPPALNGQHIGGLSFSLTDMKDAAGNYLLPETKIRGLWIDSGNIDIALVVGAIPEPTTVGLLAFGSLALLRRRRARRVA